MDLGLQERRYTQEELRTKKAAEDIAPHDRAAMIKVIDDGILQVKSFVDGDTW